MILGDIGYALISGSNGSGDQNISKVRCSEASNEYSNLLSDMDNYLWIIYGEFLGILACKCAYGEHGVIPGLIPGWNTITLFAGIGGEEFTFPIHRTHMVMTMIGLSCLSRTASLKSRVPVRIFKHLQAPRNEARSS